MSFYVTVLSMNTYLIVLSFLVNFSLCRDFYVGMFKKNDFLVAQDRLYKERRPYRYNVAKYGRIFNCPVTFFRVVDRLGVGSGPRVQITRGGLGKKYLVLQITSSYNLPLSVNIYVGCSPEKTTPYRRPPSSSEEQVDEAKAPEKKTAVAVETTKQADTTTVGQVAETTGAGATGAAKTTPPATTVKG